MQIASDIYCRFTKEWPDEVRMKFKLLIQKQNLLQATLFRTRNMHLHNSEQNYLG